MRYLDIDGNLRQIWRDDVRQDGGTTQTCATSLRSNNFQGMSLVFGILEVTNILGTPEFEATPSVLNGYITVTVRNVAPAGNMGTWNLDVWLVHSVQQHIDVNTLNPGPIHIIYSSTALDKVYELVYNGTLAAIPRGTVVRLIQAADGPPLVPGVDSVMPASGGARSTATGVVGVTGEIIAPGTWGQAVVEGRTEVRCDAATVNGGTLYLSDMNLGQAMPTMPAEWQQPIGIVKDASTFGATGMVAVDVDATAHGEPSECVFNNANRGTERPTSFSVGNSSEASAPDTTVVGVGAAAAAGSDGSVAMGYGAMIAAVNTTHNTLVGAFSRIATACEDNVVAGYSAEISDAENDSCVLVGAHSTIITASVSSHNVVVGERIIGVSGDSNVLIGQGITPALGDFNVIVGQGIALAAPISSCILVGQGITTSGVCNAGVAVGVNITLTVSGSSIVVGDSSYATNCSNAVIVGQGAHVLNADACLVMGYTTNINDNSHNSIAIGDSSSIEISGSHNTLIGTASVIYSAAANPSTDNVLVGHGAAIAVDSSNNVLVGAHSTIDGDPTPAGCILAHLKMCSVVVGANSTLGALSHHCVMVGEDVDIAGGATEAAGAHKSVAVGQGIKIAAKCTCATIIGQGAVLETGAAFNILIGADAHVHSTLANPSFTNILVGQGASIDIAGSHNILIGHNSIINSSAGGAATDNVVIGQSALLGNYVTTSVLIGAHSAIHPSATTHSEADVIIGENLTINSTGYNVVLGAGMSVTVASSAVLIGALVTASATDSVVVIGYNAASASIACVVVGAAAQMAVTASYSVLVGHGTLIQAGGTRNVVAGAAAQIISTVANPSTDNVVIGYSAELGLDSIHNVLIGAAAHMNGVLNSPCHDNVGVGYASVMGPEVSEAVLIGAHAEIKGGTGAGSAEATGKSVVVGAFSTLEIGAERSIIVGAHSFIFSSGATEPERAYDNIIVGEQAYIGSGPGSGAGSHNVLIGNASYIKSTVAAHEISTDNVVVGYGAQIELGQNDNVLVGAHATLGAYAVTVKQDKNVIIGAHATGPAGCKNAIAIGYGVAAVADACIIGSATAPVTALRVVRGAGAGDFLLEATDATGAATTGLWIRCQGGAGAVYKQVTLKIDGGGPAYFLQVTP